MIDPALTRNKQFVTWDPPEPGASLRGFSGARSKRIVAGPVDVTASVVFPGESEPRSVRAEMTPREAADPTLVIAAIDEAYRNSRETA